MDITMAIKSVVEIGITPVLLVFFVKYFFDRDKNRDKQIEEQYKNAQNRENILIAEAARREELLHEEASKREKMLRQEAEKRETHLVATIEGFSRTMERISDTMNGINISIQKMEHRIENMESTMERMREDDKPA